MKIRPVILCGGAGTRLWSNSKNHQAKQFIDFGSWTLLGKTLERVKSSIFDAPIISTNLKYLKEVKKHLKKHKISKFKIILEPAKKNTAPAILASALIKDIPNEQPLTFFSADHLIEKPNIFNKAIQKNKINLTNQNIFIFGIKPKSPSSEYGYFVTKKIRGNINKVTKFIEKPKETKAKQVINQKGYWNSGMFFLRKDSIINNFKRYQPSMYRNCVNAVLKAKLKANTYYLNKASFEKTTAKSFDYAILESNDKYIHSEVEDKIYSYWEKNNLFKPTKNKKKFSVVIPPPNVTGSLHMGHALNNSIQDLLVRYHRMNNYETLWQPGTDHAGIATQALVEKKLITEKIDKNEIGREKFIKKVWEWKEEHGDIILNQLKKLGCSCDWSRNAFTMDENLSRSVLKVFVELHKKNLIYKAEKLVNWDTVLKTAISDLEVDQREVNSKIYYIQYPIESSSDFITIATTRPETMFGDTAIAVNPKDKRFKKLIGKFVTIPIVGRKIKIIEDDYADPEQGTGALKITPAHDFNDYEVGQRNNLEIINIFTEAGKINKHAPKNYFGLDRFEARKKLLKELKEKDFFVKEENIKNKVPYGDRSNSIIEPYLTEQWFVDAKKLSVKAKEVVNSKKTNFFPSNWSKTYFQWMNNIEPWCISRQLWWGHQIPAWYGPDKKIFVAINEHEAKAEAKKHYKKDVELIRDPDVLDTWFSSGLWPFATLGWPDNKDYVDKFYPTSVLVTGFDIIFFWVARMIMFGMEFLDKEPFKDVYVHALVKDEKGQKMSKSKGNVINPLDLIEKYSADSLRFTLLSMASPGTDVKLSEDRVKGYRNFLNKLWNANNFLITNKCDFINTEKTNDFKININKWINFELLDVKNKIEKNLKDYRFDEAAKNVYQFAWHSYCDWYLELSKTILFSEDEKAKNEVRQVSAYIFKQILILLHPFIPFITEEIWLKNKFDNSNKDFLMLANWPAGNGKKDSSTNQVEKIINIISELRSFKNELNVSPGSFVDISTEEVSKNKKSFFIENETILKKLGRINNLFDKNQKKPAATLMVSGDMFKVYFAEDVDLKLIKENLIKKQKRYLEDMNKISQRLENKSFVDKAPKDIVDQEKSNYNRLRNDVERILITIKGI